MAELPLTGTVTAPEEILDALAQNIADRVVAQLPDPAPSPDPTPDPDPPPAGNNLIWVEGLPGEIAEPTAESVALYERLPYAASLFNFAARCAEGGVVVTLAVNGVIVPGMQTNPVGTNQVVLAPTGGSHDLFVGDRVDLILSDVQDAKKLSFTLGLRREVALPNGGA